MGTVKHIFVAAKHGARLNDWEPCRFFAKRSYPQVLDFFAYKGGLRALIVSGVEIRVGDSVLESAMERAP